MSFSKKIGPFELTPIQNRVKVLKPGEEPKKDL
jgi:hypothetical protein